MKSDIYALRRSLKDGAKDVELPDLSSDDEKASGGWKGKDDEPPLLSIDF